MKYKNGERYTENGTTFLYSCGIKYPQCSSLHETMNPKLYDKYQLSCKYKTTYEYDGVRYNIEKQASYVRYRIDTNFDGLAVIKIREDESSERKAVRLIHHDLFKNELLVYLDIENINSKQELSKSSFQTVVKIKGKATIKNIIKIVRELIKGL